MRRATLVLLFALSGCLGSDADHEPAKQAVELNNQAYRAFKQGELDRALLLANDAIKADREFDTAYINKAAILEKQEKPDEAVETLMALVKMRPSNVDACFPLGVLLEKTGRKTEAADYYARALKLYTERAEKADPADLSIIETNRAIAQYLMGDSKAALATLRAVLARDPEFARAIEVKQRIESGRREFFLSGV